MISRNMITYLIVTCYLFTCYRSLNRIQKKTIKMIFTLALTMYINCINILYQPQTLCFIFLTQKYCFLNRFSHLLKARFLVIKGIGSNFASMNEEGRF